MSERKIVKFRHRIWLGLVRHIYMPSLRKKFNGVKHINNLDSNCPYLILGNHTNNFDPFFMGDSLKLQIYFVATEQIFNLGLLTKFLKYAIYPIKKSKSMSDVGTIKSIKRIINEGKSVGIFPEGNVSYNGTNPQLPFAIAKLIKFLNVPVIILNMHGFYLSQPRWSVYPKKGHTDVEIRSILKPYDFQKMELGELYDYIQNKLYVNCWEEQRTNHYKYIGKSRALGIERLLVTCPSCGTIRSIKSVGNDFKCTLCGAHATYSEEGFLENNSFGADNLYDLDQQQKSKFYDTMQEKGLNKEISDQVIIYDSNHPKRKKLGNFRLVIDEQGIKFSNSKKESAYKYNEILEMAIQGQHKLIVYLKNNHTLLLDGNNNFPPYLYLMIFQYYRTCKTSSKEEVLNKLGI